MNAPATIRPSFDPYAARKDFPILERTVWDKPLVYLDSAASAQKPRQVIDRMRDMAEQGYANVHRGLHTLANEATETFENSRKAVAQFLGASAPAEVVFTKGATEAINLVAAGLGSDIAEGDEVVVSQMEHHSNIVPWHFLRERTGAKLRWVPVTDDGRLDMAAYADMLGPRTKMVALAHMSNVLGTINDASEIVRLAHGVGAPVLLDGSQAAVHLASVGVAELGVDFYVMTGHKLYGPSGIGALYARASWLERLQPYQGGGEMIATVREDGVDYADPPHKFEAGTPPILEAAGLTAAINYVSALDRGAVATHENKLAAQFTDGLRRWKDVRILGEAPSKGAIVSFASDGAHAHDVAQIMDRCGVAIRAGHHCAEPLMRRFGVTSTARASFALYNTQEEVEACLDAYGKARDLLS